MLGDIVCITLYVYQSTCKPGITENHIRYGAEVTLDPLLPACKEELIVEGIHWGPPAFTLTHFSCHFLKIWQNS